MKLNQRGHIKYSISNYKSCGLKKKYIYIYYSKYLSYTIIHKYIIYISIFIRVHVIHTHKRNILQCMLNIGASV